MQPNNFSPRLNSDVLNEHLYKKFGVRVVLEQHSREKLEDFRNRLRTKLAQTESASMFNDLIHNEEYQRDKFMVGVINQKLKEMLGESRKAINEKAKSKKQRRAAGIALAALEKGEKPKGKGAAAAMAKMPKKELEKFASTPHKGLPDKKGKKMDEDNDKKEKSSLGDQILAAQQGSSARTASRKAAAQIAASRVPAPAPKKSTSEGKKFKPDFLDGDGDRKEPMSKAAKAAKRPGASFGKNKKSKSKNSVRESHIRRVAVIQEGVARLLREDEEGKAIAITAGADMVNDFTSWMQRVGQLQTKSMIELADSIRSNFGQAESEAFKTAVQPALSAALDALTQSREQISRAVATLAGEEDAIPMGEPSSDQDTTGQDFEDMPADQEDNFADRDTAVSGPEIAGREMRESRVLLKAKKLAESNNLMRKLSGG